jgi:DNA-binding transcriptional regulator YiaG
VISAQAWAILHNRHYAKSWKGQTGRRRRVWRLSPEGFRELRHSCFLTPEACAKFLGVSLRTVHYWDAGRCRVPWAVVRLLRFVRLGDLGALDEAWSGWTVNRNGLWSPDGKRYHQGTMRHWWITCEQARWWREDYDRRTLGGVGAPAPALTLQPAAGMAAEDAAAAPAHPVGAASTLTAFAGPGGAAAGAPGAGKAVNRYRRTVRAWSAAAARSAAGLVSSSKQVEPSPLQTRFLRRFQGVRHAG